MKASVRICVGVSALAIGIAMGCRSMYQQPSSNSATTSDFLTTGGTSSFFSAVQVDPRSEDSAGPQFVEAADLDGDGMLDLVSGWNESQPVQIHLQRRTTDGDVTFLTLPLGGTTPIARVAGLKVADLDASGRPDVIVLVKDTGTVALCDASRPDCDPTDNGGVIDNAIMGMVVIFFAPSDPVTEVWQAVGLPSSKLAGEAGEGELPEDGGYTALDVGDVDGVNGPDIVLAFNSAEGDPKLNSIDLYPNPGLAFARDGASWARTMVHSDLPFVKDCKLLDVDRDGDPDVVCTYPDAKSTNVRWIVNPLDGGDAGDILRDWGPVAPIGHIHTHADTLALGDVDGDGITDVAVRSAPGKIVQWFKGPSFPSFDFIRNPWQVYTLAEFVDREPGAIVLGDLTGNGQLEAAVGAEGALAWFDSSGSLTVYDHWVEHLIIDDSPPEETTPTDPTAGGTTNLADVLQLLTDPQAAQQAATGTIINSAIIVDLDGDGANDIVATLDRSGLSGLTSDALVWFHNSLGGS